MTTKSKTVGGKSSPRSLEGHIEDVTFIDPQTNNQLVLSCLNIRYMLKCKLWACADRGVERDITDIQYLVSNYTDEIRGIANELNEEDVALFLEKLKEQDREKMSSLLTGETSS